jgi:hypothetical protein
MENRVSALDHATTSSVRSARPMTVVASGAARMSAMTSVMTVTARARLPQRLAWAARSMGHVAITIIVAQIPASRNGRSTQKLAIVNAAMVITPRTIRVRSQLRAAVFTSFMAFPRIVTSVRQRLRSVRGSLAGRLLGVNGP